MATKDQIVDTAVELGEQKSWEAVRLHDVAVALGITLDEVRAHFREKEDIVDAWFERADSAMLKAGQASDFSYLTPRQRLHRLIMIWLGAFYPYRKTTRQMIYGKLEPGHIHIQVPGLMRVSRTVQWMREAAGRDATYVRRALEESGLTTIYLATFFYWMKDNSAGSTRTSRFLEGCLSVAENLDRVVSTRRGAARRASSGASGSASSGADSEKASQTA
ncbi:MAG: TetR/AcrR family transcriptional regulator [Nitrosospira sp.]|nr:TetR/AcrR family transcriptional regulator [Nitrosospira sp.]